MPVGYALRCVGASIKWESTAHLSWSMSMCRGWDGKKTTIIVNLLRGGMAK